MIKAIIWDMDGVLINSEPYHTKANQEVFKNYGINYREEDAHNFFGLGVKEFYQKVAGFYKTEFSANEADEKFKEKNLTNFSTLIPLNSNAKDVLLKLNKLYKMALATSTPRIYAEVVLKRFGLEKVFKAVVCGDEVEKGKPNPDIYLKAAEKLEVDSKNCVAIEDSVNGMKSAKTAGMKVVAYKSDHNNFQDFSLADFVVTNLNEIPKILERFNS